MKDVAHTVRIVADGSICKHGTNPSRKGWKQDCREPLKGNGIKKMKRRIIRMEDIADMNTLREGWINASTGDGKEHRKAVVEYDKNLEANLLRLHRELLNGSWTPDKGRTRRIWSEGKWREIHIVGVEDRIVHYALVKTFNLSQFFVNRTFGSIKGRGTLKANKQVRQDLHHIGMCYVLKLDVRKYYPNINKSIFLGMLNRCFKGQKAINLYAKVICAYKPTIDKGMSIGSLTSQDGGNFYLTPLDCFVLYIIKVRYYTRYVDDMALLFKTKEEAVEALTKVKEFAKNLGLEFGKVSIFPITARRIDFCGYAIGYDNVRLRRRIKKRMIGRLRYFNHNPKPIRKERNSIYSYLGYTRHSNTFNLLKSLRYEYNQVFNRINRCSKGKGM